ncbi:MAG: hypothetical protein SNH27_15705 [Rikenellaceae bacterium]
MKNLIKIIFWAMVAFVGSRVFGGGFGWWILAVIFGRALFQFVFTAALAIILYVAFYALIIAGVLAILLIH